MSKKLKYQSLNKLIKRAYIPIYYMDPHTDIYDTLRVFLNQWLQIFYRQPKIMNGIRQDKKLWALEQQKQRSVIQFILALSSVNRHFLTIANIEFKRIKLNQTQMKKDLVLDYGYVDIAQMFYKTLSYHEQCGFTRSRDCSQFVSDGHFDLLEWIVSIDTDRLMPNIQQLKLIIQRMDKINSELIRCLFSIIRRNNLKYSCGWLLVAVLKQQDVELAKLVIELSEQQLDNKINIHSSNFNTEYVLDTAVQTGNLAIVQFVIGLGEGSYGLCDIHTDQDRLFHKACFRNSLIAEYFVQLSKGSYGPIDFQFRKSLIMLDACQYNRMDVLVWLHKLSADPTIGPLDVHAENNNAILCAYDNQNEQMVLLLEQIAAENGTTFEMEDYESEDDLLSE